MVAAQEQPGKWFSDYLAARNLTANAISERTGIDRAVITRMKNNVRPRVETLEELAEYLGEDPNDWREAWGYRRGDERAQLALSGWEMLVDGLAEIQRLRPDAPVLHGNWGERHEMTPERATEHLNRLRRSLGLPEL